MIRHRRLQPVQANHWRRPLKLASVWVNGMSSLTYYQSSPARRVSCNALSSFTDEMNWPSA